MTTLVEGRPFRTLDFDIENRPLSYWVPEMPTAEITAIASCWTDDLASMEVWLLQPTDDGPRDILERFLVRYTQADMVTGHYIRKHDLPIINGALYELDMPLLSDKLTCDTKLDMFTKADVPATQEYLLETLHVKDVYGQPVRKVHMTQEAWRSANRLTPAGLALTRERVASDVFGHMQLRLEMLKRGMLRAPSMWRSGSAAVAIGRMHD